MKASDKPSVKKISSRKSSKTKSSSDNIVNTGSPSKTSANASDTCSGTDRKQKLSTGSTKATKKSVLKKNSKQNATSDTLVEKPVDISKKKARKKSSPTDGAIAEDSSVKEILKNSKSSSTGKKAQVPKSSKVFSRKSTKVERAQSDGEDNIIDDKQAEVKHAALLKGLQSLDGKKAPIAQRNETSNNSEYHSKEQRKVHFGELLKSLNSTSDLKKYVNQQDGSRKVSQPLEKIHAQKAERTVSYTETKSEVEKWQTIVEENRVVPQQQFPLEKSRISVPTAKREAATQQPRSAMELEIQALLKGPQFVAEQAALAARPVLTKAEERAEKAMDVAKAREELAVRRKHRRMVSDAASKNRRQGKIKSRNYHRHLRTERKKTAYKALEKLRSQDPDTWQEKAEEIERARIEERATLRHKGRSKFAKLAKRYGKFNEKIKDSLDAMRSKGVELMTKQAADESSSEEEEESEGEQRADVDMDASDESDDGEETGEEEEVTSQQNPWMSGKLTKEVTHQPSRKPQPLLNTEAFDSESSSDDDGAAEINAIASAQSTGDIEVIEPDLTGTLADDDREEVRRVSKLEVLQAAREMIHDADELVDGQSTRRLHTRADVDRFAEEFEGEQVSASALEEGEDSSSDEEVTADRQDIDPDNVISIPSTDLSGKANVEVSDSEDDQHRLNIAQAFADDDVVEEFSARRKRKYDEEDEAADADAALQKLPGWGRWAGAGMEERKPKKRLTRWQLEQKRRADLRKAAVNIERDAKRSKYPKGVIVNEEAIRSQPVAKYQVQAPKMRMTTHAFNSLMSHPVGREFVPMLAHNELCQPRVLTAIGTIIAPMSKDMVKEKKGTFPKSTAETGKRIAKQYDLEPIKKRPFNNRKRARLLAKT